MGREEKGHREPRTVSQWKPYFSTALAFMVAYAYRDAFAQLCQCGWEFVREKRGWTQPGCLNLFQWTYAILLSVVVVGIFAAMWPDVDG